LIVSVDRASALRNAEKLLRQGRLDQAIAEYLRVVDDQPSDWTTANALGDLHVRANQIDKAVEQFARIAEGFFQEGFLPKAGALYKKILKLNPDDEKALSRAAEIAARQGLFVDARAHLNAIAERQRGRGDLTGAAETVVRLGALDPSDYNQRVIGARARFELLDVAGAVSELKAIAEDLSRKNRPAEALEALREAARFDPTDTTVKTRLATLLVARGDGPSVGEAQSLVLDLAGAAVAHGEWQAAADLLEDFLVTVPTNVPALIRLVEIAVDGDLGDLAGRAQARLADAYLAAGAVAEARHIAEDLAVRDPLDATHVARWRRTLEMLGERDPDGIIRERLHAPQVDETDHPPPVAPQVAAASSQPPTLPSAPVEERPVRQSAPVVARSQNVEVDLSVVLDDLRKTQAPVPQTQALTGDLEGVFAQLREEASKRVSADSAEQDFHRGMALHGAGQFEEAEPALERASRAPRFRFEAAFVLGRISRARGETWAAIDWLERAAQAPAPSTEQAHRLLFELADLLESAGEVARALAICLELQAEAGAYEDLDARVERLAKVQTTPG
jgi:tetratricopeptide (TPR) repeat protein